MNWMNVAAAAVFALGGLAGCGGGGGGGGGGVAFPPIVSGPSASALSVTVSVNDGAIRPDGQGRYVLKAGDVVSIAANQGVNWSSQAAPAGSVSLSRLNIDSQKWTARLGSNSAEPAEYTVVASLPSGNGLPITMTFVVPGGDSRNGEYQVFATNGSRQTLKLNFDTLAYTMTDAAGDKDSGEFSADAHEPGSFIFLSARNTAKAVTSRFRVVADTVVGGFPFALPKQSGVYGVQPFFASRALVTTQSDIDGTFTRLGINMQASSRDSQIVQVEVSGGGKFMRMCRDNAITSVASCPVGSLVTYSVEPGAAAASWKVVNVNNPQETGLFSVARVAGKKVFLIAGVNSMAPNDAVFRIGLEESTAWPDSTATGSDTQGSWASMGFSATRFNTARTHADATVAGFGAELTKPSATISNLTLFFGLQSDAYFGTQDGTLSVIVGARGGAVAGYMHIGLKR